MIKLVEKIIRVIVNILLFITTIAIIFSLYGFYQLKIQKQNYFNIFGYTAFNVITGSMSPTLEVGDIIIVKITKDVKVDDVITYYKNNDFITHRVISINGEDLVTRGDSNNSSDSPVKLEMVVGKVVRTFHKVGTMVDILLTPKIFISIVITLFLFSICFSYIPKSKTKIKYDKDGIEILEIDRRSKKWYQKKDLF